MTATKTTAKRSAARNSADGQGFTAEEREAMRDRAREEKAAKGKADGEKDLLAKVAEMSPPDRAMAEKIHALIRANVPVLESKTWYGMPAYAKDGKVVCFFQSADKFKARYATFGFSDEAMLDDGNFWPTSWALTKLTAADEATIVKLVKKAVG